MKSKTKIWLGVGAFVVAGVPALRPKPRRRRWIGLSPRSHSRVRSRRPMFPRQSVVAGGR
jgi:uncharacterized membrane protein